MYFLSFDNQSQPNRRVPSRFFVSDPVMKYWTDYVSETDWAVGYILEYLKIHAPNTMVGALQLTLFLQKCNSLFTNHCSHQQFCPPIMALTRNLRALIVPLNVPG